MSLKTEKTDIIAGFKYLSSSHRNLHEQRQKYEWKVVFTVLTLFVFTVSAFYTKEIKTIENYKIITISLLCLVFIGLILISWKFLKSIHTANSTNVQIAEYSENNINNIINDKETIFINLNAIGSDRRLWALYWQITTIILFAVVASGLIILRLV